jgi:hypothetical protein
MTIKNIERRALLAILVGVAAATSVVRAAEKKPEPAKAAGKADPSGTWTWTITTPNGTFEPKLTLKLEGDKLTGSMSGRGGQDHPIENATYKAGDIAFKVVRERNGEKFTTDYSGKLSGDTIKGTMKGRFGGEDRTNPWEAKRVK